MTQKLSASLFFGILISGCATHYTKDTPESVIKEDIASVVRDHESEVIACYDRELADLRKHRKDLSGKIEMIWTIDPDGKVTKLRPHKIMPNGQRLARCLSKKIKQWEFTPPPEGKAIEVSWPWFFKSNR